MQDRLQKILLGLGAIAGSLFVVLRLIPSLINQHSDLALMEALAAAFMLVAFLYFTAQYLGLIEEKDTDDE